MFYAAELEITEKKFLSKFSALKTSQVQWLHYLVVNHNFFSDVTEAN